MENLLSVGIAVLLEPFFQLGSFEELVEANLRQRAENADFDYKKGTFTVLLIRKKPHFP